MKPLSLEKDNLDLITSANVFYKPDTDENEDEVLMFNEQEKKSEFVHLKNNNLRIREKEIDDFIFKSINSLSAALQAQHEDA